MLSRTRRNYEPGLLANSMGLIASAAANDPDLIRHDADTWAS